MTVIELDAQKMTGRKQAHVYLKESLRFPDYYGCNLDALYDCLTDSADLQICFVNTQDAPAYFEKVLRVFREAAQDHPGLTVLEAEESCLHFGDPSCIMKDGCAGNTD